MSMEFISSNNQISTIAQKLRISVILYSVENSEIRKIVPHTHRVIIEYMGSWLIDIINAVAVPIFMFA